VTDEEEQLRQYHLAAHQALDQLVARWAFCTGRLFSQATIMELIMWSHQQTIQPTTEPARPWIREKVSE